MVDWLTVIMSMPTTKVYYKVFHNALLSAFVMASVVVGIIANRTTNLVTITELAIYSATSLFLIAYISTREMPSEHDHRWWVILVCWVSVLHVALYQYPDIAQTWPLLCLVTANIVGDITVAYLRSSFSILPARRKIREGWLYRIVRHPIYAVYIIADVLYLFLKPTPRNGLVAIIGIASFFVRAHLEESLLFKDPAYVLYAKKVRYRFFPGLI